jgi:hypothetical protein
MNKKLILSAVLLVILVTFLEITFYFIYIFKPIDRITGHDLGVPKGIPVASEIMTPILLSRYINQADEIKDFYPKRLGDYTKSVESIIQSKSSFMKTAEANYILAGTVQEIITVKDANNDIFPAYNITLKNSTGDKYLEHISSSEAQYVQVSLETVTPGNFSTTKKDITDIINGDYISIKRSDNLLNPSEVNIEIKILRTIK